MADDIAAQIAALLAVLPTGTRARTMTRPLAETISAAGDRDSITRATDGTLGDTVGVFHAAQALKHLALEIDTVVHAIGMAAALRSRAVLADGERVEAVSLDQDGSGPAARFPNLPAADLVTDRQAAEFTFIQWAPTGSNGTRVPKLVVDLTQLDLDERVGDRRRVLYVHGPAVHRVLNSGASIQRLLRVRNPDLADRFADRYGDEFRTIGEYWPYLHGQGRVDLVDLAELDVFALAR